MCKIISRWAWTKFNPPQANCTRTAWKNWTEPEIGRDGKWSLDVYDPDGTRVEVMEFTPAKEPCCHPYTADHPKP